MSRFKSEKTIDKRRNYKLSDIQTAQFAILRSTFPTMPPQLLINTLFSLGIHTLGEMYNITHQLATVDHNSSPTRANHLKVMAQSKVNQTDQSPPSPQSSPPDPEDDPQ